MSHYTDAQYRRLAEELYRSRRGQEPWFDTGKRFAIMHPYVTDVVYLTQILIPRMTDEDWGDMNDGMIAGHEENERRGLDEQAASVGGLVRPKPKRRRIRTFG
jgi:hypothetical protein